MAASALLSVRQVIDRWNDKAYDVHGYACAVVTDERVMYVLLDHAWTYQERKVPILTKEQATALMLHPKQAIVWDRTRIIVLYQGHGSEMPHLFPTFHGFC